MSGVHKVIQIAYNQKTGNSGVIKITRSYLEGPYKM